MRDSIRITPPPEKCLTLYLSNTAWFALCIACIVKDHHDSLHSSPLLKNTSVRQVVL